MHLRVLRAVLSARAVSEMDKVACVIIGMLILLRAAILTASDPKKVSEKDLALAVPHVLPPTGSRTASWLMIERCQRRAPTAVAAS